jgi:hypothetical protein
VSLLSPSLAPATEREKKRLRRKRDRLLLWWAPFVEAEGEDRCCWFEGRRPGCGRRRRKALGIGE